MLKLLITFFFILLFIIFVFTTAERKVLAFIQLRRGPIVPGSCCTLNAIMAVDGLLVALKAVIMFIRVALSNLKTLKITVVQLLNHIFMSTNYNQIKSNIYLSITPFFTIIGSELPKESNKTTTYLIPTWEQFCAYSNSEMALFFFTRGTATIMIGYFIWALWPAAVTGGSAYSAYLHNNNVPPTPPTNGNDTLMSSNSQVIDNVSPSITNNTESVSSNSLVADNALSSTTNTELASLNVSTSSSVLSPDLEKVIVNVEHSTSELLTTQQSIGSVSSTINQTQSSLLSNLRSSNLSTSNLLESSNAQAADNIAVSISTQPNSNALLNQAREMVEPLKAPLNDVIEQWKDLVSFVTTNLKGNPLGEEILKFMNPTILSYLAALTSLIIFDDASRIMVIANIRKAANKVASLLKLLTDKFLMQFYEYRAKLSKKKAPNSYAISAKISKLVKTLTKLKEITSTLPDRLNSLIGFRWVSSPSSTSSSSSLSTGQSTQAASVQSTFVRSELSSSSNADQPAVASAEYLAAQAASVQSTSVSLGKNNK